MTNGKNITVKIKEAYDSAFGKKKQNTLPVQNMHIEDN